MFNKLLLLILLLVFQISKYKKEHEILFWISHLRYCLFSLSFMWFAISRHRHSQYILYNYGEKWMHTFKLKDLCFCMETLISDHNAINFVCILTIRCIFLSWVSDHPLESENCSSSLQGRAVTLKLWSTGLSSLFAVPALTWGGIESSDSSPLSWHLIGQGFQLDPPLWRLWGCRPAPASVGLAHPRGSVPRLQGRGSCL